MDVNGQSLDSKVRCDLYSSSFSASPSIGASSSAPLVSSRLVSGVMLVAAASYLYKGVTQVVNGLACFYERGRVLLCNVSTGEILGFLIHHPILQIVHVTLAMTLLSVNRVYKLLRLNVDYSCREAKLRNIVGSIMECIIIISNEPIKSARKEEVFIRKQ